MTDRRGMVGWYDPPRLMSIAIRVAISTVFGEFADRREAMASARRIDPQAIDPVYDYSASESGFGFDFIADAGDGWNSTYAIARLLADPQLVVQGHDGPLPLAKVLVMGGPARRSRSAFSRVTANSRSRRAAWSDARVVDD